ncbi:glycoside hydrolase family 18 [Sphingobacterium paludis]|uniref:Glycosyl hydrolase family 18 (Putative chitinase) n=1 Tax=Sphingobacterium paludis TaxID=1476465 RepID=A0A4R7CSU2_9SPHI|nr:glycoside hydrolase family 18 [Sphingobacterium paludis]TDS08897.1 glycosyl hydrolase family 18 (putative chitinase) [Sphingobacterium paludis]
MNAIKFQLYVIILITSLCFSAACKKHNDPLAEAVERLTPQRDDVYYENLRAYKRSDHQIYFGWWGGLNTPGSPETMSVIDQIPDSVDIVAFWGGMPPLGSHNWETMQQIRKTKGTRFVITSFGSGVEQIMRRNDPQLVETDVMKAIDDVARAIADTIALYNIDGFDLDYEPSESAEFNSIFGSRYAVNGRNPHVLRLFEALGKYLGPKSGTDKLLIIDGYSHTEIEPYYNYFMQQAYNSSSPTVLQNRLRTYGLGECPPHKFVPCENFEANWRNGGVTFSDPRYGRIPSLLGFAYWNPIEGPKGGIGSYHTEYEYPLNPDYKWTREAIQILNPAVQ